MTEALFLGVDGGGTKTDFVCIDGAETVRATATTGTTHHLEVGLDQAIDRLGRGIHAVCAALSIAPADVRHAFIGLPAFGEDSVADPQLRAAGARLLGHDRFACGNDMVCAWAGSLGCEDGINIVAGTGSIGYGEHGGRAARAGGWGEVFGDEGSAYWIAVRGLSLFTRMSDGRAPKGPLHALMADALSLGSDIQMCERVLGPNGMGRSGIAGLARVVAGAAEVGDTAARAILAAAAEELVTLAAVLRDTLAFPAGTRVPLSWSGGVFNDMPFVRKNFVAALPSQGFDAVSPASRPASAPRCTRGASRPLGRDGHRAPCRGAPLGSRLPDIEREARAERAQRLVPDLSGRHDRGVRGPDREPGIVVEPRRRIGQGEQHVVRARPHRPRKCDQPGEAVLPSRQPRSRIDPRRFHADGLAVRAPAQNQLERATVV